LKRLEDRRALRRVPGRILDSAEVASLIAELDALRWTGRKGYGVWALVGACLAKALYAIPTWTRTARLIAEHTALAATIGGTPSEWACYRFAAKLRAHSPLVEATLGAIVSALRAELSEYGKDIAIDASDLTAYANGMRLVSKNGPERERFSHPDASWGHRSAISTRRGGGFYGCRLHAAVCTRTGLPLAWEVSPANTYESTVALPLLDAAHSRGFPAETCALDKGYDVEFVYEGCETRDVRPIMPLRMTPAVKREPDSAPAASMAAGRSRVPTSRASFTPTL
jgi:IS5 family transposase